MIQLINLTIHIIAQSKRNLLMQRQAHKLILKKKTIKKNVSLKVADHVRISKYKNFFAKG